MMLTILLVFLACTSSMALADLVPVAPGPGDVFYSGSNCTIAWNVDQTGTWKNVSIDLMTGPNNAMVLVTNVLDGLDGTSTIWTHYNWTCPDVDPHSAIYFYQFTNGGNTSGAQWTTRFTIASPSGATSPPGSSTQPNGDAIPWGTGHLASNASEPSVGVQALTASSSGSSAGLLSSTSFVADQPSSTISDDSTVSTSITADGVQGYSASMYDSSSTTSTVSFVAEGTGPTSTSEDPAVVMRPTTGDPHRDHEESRTHIRTRHQTRTDDNVGPSAQALSDDIPTANPTSSMLHRPVTHRSTFSSNSAATLVLPPTVPAASEATSDTGLPPSLGRTMISRAAGQGPGQACIWLALLSVLMFL